MLRACCEVYSDKYSFHHIVRPSILELRKFAPCSIITILSRYSAIAFPHELTSLAFTIFLAFVISYQSNEFVTLIVFCCRSFFFVNALLLSFDYKDRYEFHLWNPLMESRFGIRLFLYIKKNFKIVL